MVAKDAYFLGDRRGLKGMRRLWKVAAFAGVGVLLLLAADGLFLRLTRIAPPPIPAEVRAAAELPLTVRDGRAMVGRDWMSRERGVWELHLEGEPYAMGWAHSRL